MAQNTQVSSEKSLGSLLQIMNNIQTYLVQMTVARRMYNMTTVLLIQEG